MKRKFRLVSFFETSLIAICAIVLLSLFAYEQTANGQKKQMGPRGQRWEYCEAQLTDVYGKSNNTTVAETSICYLRSTGAQCEKLETTIDGPLANSAAMARANGWAKAISKLGAAGWEMVGEGMGTGDKGDVRLLYFKRPVL